MKFNLDLLCIDPLFAETNTVFDEFARSRARFAPFKNNPRDTIKFAVVVFEVTLMLAKVALFLTVRFAVSIKVDVLILPKVALFLTVKFVVDNNEVTLILPKVALFLTVRFPVSIKNDVLIFPNIALFLTVRFVVSIKDAVLIFPAITFPAVNILSTRALPLTSNAVEISVFER
jgi:hypothetical protein